MVVLFPSIGIQIRMYALVPMSLRSIEGSLTVNQGNGSPYIWSSARTQYIHNLLSDLHETENAYFDNVGMLGPSSKPCLVNAERDSQNLIVLFVCVFTYSLLWKRHHYRWRAANIDLYSALMAIEQWGLFSVPDLQWHGASVHLRGPVTLARTCFRALAVKLSLLVLTTYVYRARESNPDLPHVRRTPYNWANAAVQPIWLQIYNYYTLVLNANFILLGYR